MVVVFSPRPDASPETETQAAPPKIRLERLTKRFEGPDGRTVEAVDAVDLAVAAGEFCCLLGPSGCGKTTVLRMIGELETPTGGAIEIRREQPGRPVNSMVFQESSVFPWMTVAQNVSYGMAMRRRPRREIDDRAGYFMRKTGIWDFRDAYPYQLSGGMRQRVSVARAFANDPEILLMDEPFGALDEQTKFILHEELLRIWEESGKTVLFITHSIDEALVLADRILVMTARPGRIKAEIAVPFDRPRHVLEVKSDPRYGDMISRIWDSLGEEVTRAARLAEASA